MKKKKNYGCFIYVYKCIVGKQHDICKIGKSDDIDTRLDQHIRTYYHGFVPYTNFDGQIITTKYEVTTTATFDTLIKNDKNFSCFKLNNLEIYNIDYNECIEKLYKFLKGNGLYVSVVPDGISDYSFIEDIKVSSDESGIDTTRKAFIEIISKIKDKYKEDIPIELKGMLREKSEFETNASTQRNPIEVIDGYVLNIHYGKPKKIEILSKLKEFL